VTVFPYRLEQSDISGPIYRPMAKVSLRGPNNKSVVQYMYVDSGADHTLIPYALGLYLGLRSQGQTVYEVQGVNGSLAVIYQDIPMTIGKKSFTASLAWAQTEHVPLLLGRTDVFDQFQITFHQKKHLVTFR